MFMNMGTTGRVITTIVTTRHGVIQDLPGDLNFIVS